ncbi:hypothetical protein L210DRAFT_396831 [Boletus edulis BED1]|uniref:Uncharacterized protein n=1 Tax=Boletus edulis BED1 TaxID=1328754 RepID=A0AAD4BX37_BOLED|nr:hypothetical protein L210DRAFT_396831 [Boletus edulis BED1]
MQRHCQCTQLRSAAHAGTGGNRVTNGRVFCDALALKQIGGFYRSNLTSIRSGSDSFLSGCLRCMTMYSDCAPIKKLACVKFVPFKFFYMSTCTPQAALAMTKDLQ